MKIKRRNKQRGRKFKEPQSTLVPLAKVFLLSNSILHWFPFVCPLPTWNWIKCSHIIMQSGAVGTSEPSNLYRTVQISKQFLIFGLI